MVTTTRRWLVLALVSLILSAVLLPQATARQERGLTLEMAQYEAQTQSLAAEEARLALEDMRLEAANLEHQHELGPPGRQTITFELDLGPVKDFLEELGQDVEPIRISIPVGEPSDLEKAKIEELLPVQFAALRRTADAQFRQGMARLRSNAIEHYFGALLAQEQVALKAQTLDRLETQQQQVDLMLEQGLVPELEKSQIDAAVAQAEVDSFEAKEEAELAKKNLLHFLGRPMEDPLTLLTEDVSPDLPLKGDPETDIEKARAESAKLTALEGQLEVAEKELAIFHDAKGGFSGRRAYRERELEVEQQELQLEKARRELTLAVHSLRSNIRQAENKYQAIDQQLKAARDGYEVARLKYESGRNTLTDVLAAESDLLAAELAELGAAIGLATAQAEREALLGGVDDIVPETIESVHDDIEALR